MAAPKIALHKAADLKPDPRNARTHSPAQVDQIAASLRQFGFTNPVLADKDGIVAGHGRVLAALQVYAAGDTLRFPNGEALPAGAVPVLDVTGWSSEQRRAYLLADNQLALLAGWDDDVLREELTALGAMDFDLGTIGFDPTALHELFGGTKGSTDPDEVPPEPETPTSRPGDVWLLGDHRLACGSSTDPAAVAALLGGAVPVLMVTDPPYGVSYDPNWRNDAEQAGHGKRGAPGARSLGKVQNDDRVDWREAWELFPGDVAYVWHGHLHAGAVGDSLVAAGLMLRYPIVWAKPQFAICRGDYHWQHEACWYAVRKGKTGHWQGSRKESTLWQIDNATIVTGGREGQGEGKTGHGTQKPVECMRRPIVNNSEAGEGIYEPFAGSSTTVIACEMTGRRCFAMELDAGYVDVGVLRWQGFTGRAATLEATGQTFGAVAAERAGC
jgi:DNA modification methylase